MEISWVLVRIKHYTSVSLNNLYPALMYLEPLSRYQRCQFELPLYPDSCKQPQYFTPVNISPFSRWDEISERIKPSERPVVLNRASSTNTTNPFGSTFCYGYQVRESLLLRSRRK